MEKSDFMLTQKGLDLKIKEMAKHIAMPSFLPTKIQNNIKLIKINISRYGVILKSVE